MLYSDGTANRSVIYTRPVVFCVVPTDLAPRLHALLVDWFATVPGVEVIIERRGVDRRSATGTGPGGEERRAADRRAAGRASTAAAEGWDLPWGARRHADRLGLMLLDVPVHGRDVAVAERALVERVRGGDGAAIDALYARHFPAMHAWSVRSVGRRRADALTQDIFAAALERIDDPELDRRRLEGWLRAVAGSIEI